MATVNTKRRIVTALTTLIVIGSAAFYVLAQPASDAKKSSTPLVMGKRHTLAATLETVQWGWLDPKEPPKLTVDSGDIVAVETMMHSHDKVRPGITMDEIVALRRANPGGGPHSMTGPDLRQRRRARRRDGDPHRQDRPEGVRHQLQPARQGLPDDRRAGARRCPTGSSSSSRSISRSARQSSSPASRSISGRFRARSPWASTPTIRRRARAARPTRWRRSRRCGRGRTARTWTSTSCRKAPRSSFPIFLKGGLVWTGDSHCRQGNGEVNLTALECSYREIAMQLIVRKDMKLEWPRHGDEDPLDRHGIRRGPQQGDGQRGPRDGGLPGSSRRWCR